MVILTGVNFAGDMLRSVVASGQPLGKKIKEVMDAGQLVNDVLMGEMIEDAIKSCDKGFLLDGFPRNANQAALVYIHIYGGCCLFVLQTPPPSKGMSKFYLD